VSTPGRLPAQPYRAVAIPFLHRWLGEYTRRCQVQAETWRCNAAVTCYWPSWLDVSRTPSGPRPAGAPQRSLRFTPFTTKLKPLIGLAKLCSTLKPRLLSFDSAAGPAASHWQLLMAYLLNPLRRGQGWPTIPRAQLPHPASRTRSSSTAISAQQGPCDISTSAVEHGTVRSLQLEGLKPSRIWIFTANHRRSFAPSLQPSCGTAPTASSSGQRICAT